MSDGIETIRVGVWRRFVWLRHGFSTRSGGISSIYGGRTLNLGWTKEDETTLVAENRRSFLRYVDGDLGDQDGSVLVGLRQIHSDVVHVVREADGALGGKLQTADGRAVLEGDGLVTNVPGVLIGVGTADCVPVLVVDQEKRAVGAFHAGWRGTVAQIVERGVAMMMTEYGSRVEDLEAAVGPSIGACCYSVGREVHREFRERFAYGEELFRVGVAEEEEKLYLDLWEANRRQLLEAGVGEDRITVVGECSACKVDSQGELKYFSHRGEKGVAGRMLSVVGVAREPQ
ncbi:peptidoglycan editing factor PgeF [Tunturiibacter gelidiferens]|uniref:peptidoglycan editing factor PgeF n=1 Tax=Tunturiibacter gelidiferens TaxID=3069689 RepID=UPI003D9B7E96